MKHQKLIYFITGIIISIQIKASNQQITYNPSYNTKTIAHIFIASKCFWGNLSEHDSLQCGNCKQINDGKIVETYRISEGSELIITKKTLFEPTLFLTNLLNGILQKTIPNNSNVNTLKKNQEIWNSNKQKIIRSFQNILKIIHEYKKYNNINETIHSLPEFCSMNTCSILWLLNTQNEIKHFTKINGCFNPIKINDQVAIPESEFTCDFFKMNDKNDNTSSNKSTIFETQISIILDLISIISSSKKKSILNYNPNVQEVILLNALQKIKSINPYLNIQCN